MHGKLGLEIGVDGFEGDEFFVGVDGVIPGAFGERFGFEHGRVVRGIGGAETGRKGADALVAVDGEIKNVDDEGVAGFGTVDEERAGEGIIDFDVGERVARFLQGVAETVEGVGVEFAAGGDVGDGCGGAEGGFDVVHGGVELDGGGRLRGRELREK